MSVAQTLDIEAYRMLDNRLSMNQDTRQFQVPIGGSNVTYRSEPSTSAGTSNQITFNLTPNSPNNVIDRTMLFAAGCTINFTRQNGGAPMLRNGQDALRGFNHVVQSTNLTINGMTISQETKYLQDIFNRFTDDLDSLVQFKSISPSLKHPDTTRTYAGGTGSNMNPLGGFNTATIRSQGRGVYPIKVISNNNNDAQIQFDIHELMTISPLEYQGCQVPGLANCTSLSLNFNLESDRSRIWSRDPDGGETNFAVSVVFDTPKIHFCEISLPVFYSLPPSVSTSYYDLQRQVTTVSGNIGPRGSGTIRSNTYQLNQAPSRVIIYAKNTESTPLTTDTFGVITKLDIQYNNMSSILNSATTEQLFMISSVNGSNQSWADFFGSAVDYSVPVGDFYGGNLTSGSIICLDFGKDISSDPTSIPGTSINANFSVEATIQNRINADTTYELVIVYVYAGVLVVSPGSAFKYTSILTRDETLSLPLIEGAQAGNADLKGGAKPMKQLKAAFSTGMDVLKDYKSKKASAVAGARAGTKGNGVYTEGKSAGLSGGQAVSSASLRDRFA